MTCPWCSLPEAHCICPLDDMLAERAAEDHYDLTLRPARESAQVRSAREHQLRLSVDDAPYMPLHLRQWADESEASL